MNRKIFRITTVPISLQKLIVGQLPFMRSKGFEPFMISADGPEVASVKEEQNCLHFTVPMTRKITPIQDVVALWKFYRLCKQHHPRIVHSHTPKAGIVGMLGSKLAGVPVRLHTVAGMPLMEEKGIKRYILEMVEKLTYSCATKIYPNSALLSNFITSNNLCSQKKIKVIGNGSSNGIDTSFYSLEALDTNSVSDLKKQLNIGPKDFVYIYIGRIVKDKGITELVTAFKELQTYEQAIKLILVGPLEQDLDPLPVNVLKEIETNASIISVGYKGDVRPYLAISNALVFPSYREGFPNVPLQAGCFNLPSIVTNINGCNEIVVDGRNGILIPVKDAVALKDAMLRLLSDKNLYEGLKAQARSMIVDRYNQQHFWELLYNEYQDQLVKHEAVIS